jgi:hypothetical protein
MCNDRRYCCCNSALNPCGADQDDDVPPLDVDDEQLVDGYSGIVTSGCRASWRRARPNATEAM